MVIYDASGGERVIITYNSFEFNPDLADELFKVETAPAIEGE